MAAQRGGGSSADTGTGARAVAAAGIPGAPSEGKRRRLVSTEHRSSTPSAEARAVSGGRIGTGSRSPLESIEERSRQDLDWAAWHHRQAWFLQVRHQHVEDLTMRSVCSMRRNYKMNPSTAAHETPKQRASAAVFFWGRLKEPLSQALASPKRSCLVFLVSSFPCLPSIFPCKTSG